MRGRRTLVIVVLLALLSMGGIVGLLLAEGGWDVVFFGVAALPLGVGAWRLRRASR